MMEIEESLQMGIESRLKAKLTDVLTSPTLVWFASLYIFSLASIISFNIARQGFNAQGFFGGPEYYANLYLHYGLNASSTYASPVSKGFLAWIYVPFLTVFLGLPMIFLKEAGWAYNSPFYETNQANLKYAFFRDAVFGYEVVIFGHKGNAFYLGTVWLPIIAASLVTVMYKLHTKRDTWLVSRFIISFIIAMWLGIEFAKMTDPNLHFDWSQFFPTLTGDRFNNKFVVYDGEYSPTMLGVIMTLFQILPMIIITLMEGVYNGYKLFTIKRGLFTEVEVEKTVKIDNKSLPWIKEALERGEIKEELLADE